MQPNIQLNAQVTQSLAAQQNKVLRSTYLLLALSMIPTVIGAAIGVRLGFGGSWMSALIPFAVAIGLIFAIQRYKTSAIGVFLLLAFTFVMGVALSGILRTALGFSNGWTLIAMAATGTGAIFFTLAGIATVTKKDFGFLGNFLFIGLVMLVLALIANFFFAIPMFSLVISGAAVLLFSGFILYHISRIVTGGETNYVSATLDVYLAVYNLFVHLLNILMILAGNRE